MGVVDGTDYKYTGQVRRMQTKKIRAHLDAGEIVMLTNIGFSSTAETFNVSSLEVATIAASELEAEKLILFTPNEASSLLDTETDQLVRQLRLSEARGILRKSGNEPTQWPLPEEASSQAAYWARFEGGVRALVGGCSRAHLISGTLDGGLLAELYTRDGVGLMISRDAYEEVRRATSQDLRAIMDLVRPLEDSGVLVARSTEQLERELPYFYVSTRDGMAVACAALIPYGNDQCEIACVVTHQDYRRSGRAAALVATLEREAMRKGVSSCFSLTTRTMGWFVEHGYEESDISELPQERIELIASERGSKVYRKNLLNSSMNAP